jgi:hypothetical protein
MVTNLMAADSIGFGQFVRIREIRVAAPTVLILEEKACQGNWSNKRMDGT